VKVGVRTNNALAEFLTAEGFDVVRLEGIDWLSRTDDLRVICIDAHQLRGEKEVATLSKFVREGGGLVIAATGWGWASLNPGKSLNSIFPATNCSFPPGSPSTAGLQIALEPVALRSIRSSRSPERYAGARTPWQHMRLKHRNSIKQRSRRRVRALH
jgi:hypothetical protein